MSRETGALSSWCSSTKSRPVLMGSLGEARAFERALGEATAFTRVVLALGAAFAGIVLARAFEYFWDFDFAMQAKPVKWWIVPIS